MGGVRLPPTPFITVMTAITTKPNRHPEPEAPQVCLGPTRINDDPAIRLVDDVPFSQVAGHAVVMIVGTEIQPDRTPAVR